MNFISGLMLAFSLLGALDRIFGNKFGLGKEFERGFMLLGTMALSMIGMIVISPFIAQILSPFFDVFYNTFGIDPSIIPATFFANDMGGAALAVEIAENEEIGLFNALVVSSMMGATISFTVPFGLGLVKKELHREMFLGFLCGIVTIPIGCFISGLTLGLSPYALFIDLLPLILFSVIIAVGLILIPEMCVKVFSILGVFIKIVITFGLALGIFRFMTGIEIIKGLAPIEEGGAICLNAAIVISGAFPLIFVLSKLLDKPLKKLGSAIGINNTSAIGLLSTLASISPTFEIMNDMDKKGTMINSAFAVSAAFTFAGHLAFTMAFDASYISPMIIGKLISGFCALILSIVLYKKLSK